MKEVFFPKGFVLISKVCRPVNLIMVFTLGVKYSSTDISSSKCWREFKKFGKIYFMSLKFAKRKVILKSNFEPTLFVLIPLKCMLTPKRHEHSVEDGAGVVEQVGDPGVVADLVQGPRAAVGALRAHRDAETGHVCTYKQFRGVNIFREIS